MTSAFGGAIGYVAPSTRVLTSITESPTPNAEDFASPEKTAQLIQTHDYQLKDLATQMKQVQKGVNDATANPIQQIQQFISDVVVLMGGGQLAEGALDFGDLQYILPTLGALFGIGDGPFPLDLFAAAEKLFFGYVVPVQQFTDLINNMIGAWMNVFGIDPKFIKDTKALITAIGQLFGEVGNLLPSMNTFFDALNPGGGGTAGSALGPLGAALGPIIKFFAGIDLKNFGSAFEFVTAAMDPWIVKLTAIINFLNEVLAVLGSGQNVVNDPLPQVIVPIQNLVKFLGNIQFGIESFNPVTMVQAWLGQLLLPLGNLSTVQPNLQMNPGFDDSSDLGNAADGKNWTREDLDPPVTDNDWAWDLLGRTADGSATVVANGVDHGLLGDVIYVDEGHTFDFDTYVQWDGLTAATGAVALHIQTNDGTNTVIDSVPSPGATGVWTHLTGSYTVPTGVTTIRLRLFVGAGATAGQLWFDDTNIRRTNLIHQGLIQDLVANLQELFGNFTIMLTAIGAGDVATMATDIGAGITNAASALSKISDMLTNAVVSTPAELGALAKTAQDNANAVGTNLQSILNNSEAATYAALGASVAGSAASLADIAENAVSGAAVATTAAAQAMQAGWGALVSGLTGVSTPVAAAATGGAAGLPSVQAAAASMAASVGSATERLAIIGNGAEEQVSVDFSTFSNGVLPSEFTVISGSGMSINGGNLVAGPDISSPFGEIILYNSATALTDYQQISGVFTAAPTDVVPMLIGRMDGAGDAYVAAIYSVSGFWQLWFQASGSGSQVTTFDDVFTPGATYTLACGNPAGSAPRQYAVLKNGTPLNPGWYVESGTSSQLGGGFRGCGIGSRGASGVSYSMSSFAFQDTVQSSPSVLVTTAESTTSTTYTSLTTISDEVAVNIGASGKADVKLFAKIHESAATAEGLMGFAMSGANSSSASDDLAVMYQAFTSNGEGQIGASFLLTDLSPGLTLFKAKYRCTGGTVTFSNRRIGVVAL